MKLRRQSLLGKATILALSLVIFVGYFASHASFRPPVLFNGGLIANGNKAFARHLGRLQKTGGVLFLGTSETGRLMNDQNFWVMLRKIPQWRNTPISVIAGAGRASYVWFPQLLANCDAFSGLRVVYYLNPTYWRDSLNEIRPDYYYRYNSPNFIRNMRGAMDAHGLADFIPTPDPKMKLALGSSEFGSLDDAWESLHSIYFEDLRDLVADRAAWLQSDSSSGSGDTLPTDEALLADQDPLFGVSREYLGDLANLAPVSSSDFQTRALVQFLYLNQECKTRLTVFLGPINGVLGRAEHLDSTLAQYEVLHADIRRILQSESVDFVDGWDLSYLSGVFDDAQHHSGYGAKKIALMLTEKFFPHVH